MKFQTDPFLSTYLFKTMEIYSAELDLHQRACNWLKTASQEFFRSHEFAKKDECDVSISKADKAIAFYNYRELNHQVSRVFSAVQLSLKFESELCVPETGQFGCYAYAKLWLKNKGDLNRQLENVRAAYNKAFLGTHRLDLAVYKENECIGIAFGDKYDKCEITRPQTLEAMASDLIALGNEALRIIKVLESSKAVDEAA